MNREASGVQIFGLPESTPSRVDERDTRKRKRALLTPLLEARLKEHGTEHWVDILNAKGVPSGDILTLEAALEQPQVKHRESIQPVHESELGDIRVFNLTAKFEKTPASVDAPPPRLSAHTFEILRSIGLSEQEIEAMRAEKAIGDVKEIVRA